MMERIFTMMIAIILLSGIVNAAVEIEGGMVGLGLVGAGINVGFEDSYFSIRGSYFPIDYGIYCLKLGKGIQVPKEGLTIGPIILRNKMEMNLNGIFEGVGRYFRVEGVIFKGLTFGFEGTVEYVVKYFDSMYIGIWMGGILPIFGIDIEEKRGSWCFLPYPPFLILWSQWGLVIRFGD